MLEKGATKKEAAWVTLGSTLGMFSVDKYTGIGEIFFDDERAALMSEARKALKKEISDATQAIYQGGVRNTPKGLFNKG
jgi:protein-arginine kinase